MCEGCVRHMSDGLVRVLKTKLMLGRRRGEDL